MKKSIIILSFLSLAVLSGCQASTASISFAEEGGSFQIAFNSFAPNAKFAQTLYNTVVQGNSTYAAKTGEALPNPGASIALTNPSKKWGLEKADTYSKIIIDDSFAFQLAFDKTDAPLCNQAFSGKTVDVSCSIAEFYDKDGTLLYQSEAQNGASVLVTFSAEHYYSLYRSSIASPAVSYPKSFADFATGFILSLGGTNPALLLNSGYRYSSTSAAVCSMIMSFSSTSHLSSVTGQSAILTADNQLHSYLFNATPVASSFVSLAGKHTLSLTDIKGGVATYQAKTTQDVTITNGSISIPVEFGGKSLFINASNLLAYHSGKQTTAPAKLSAGTSLYFPYYSETAIAPSEIGFGEGLVYVNI